MVTRVLIRPNSYHDSVSLMAVSQKVAELPGVEAAVVAMGTDMNKELLQNVGLLAAEANGAGPADLIIAVGAADEEAAAAAITAVDGLLKKRSATRGAGPAAAAPKTIRAAVKAESGANLALISVPGAFAAREARIALEQGLHVMLYSDNVTLEDEVALKQLAHEKGLLLMGPDCGTAILDGVGLGFANTVRRGPVGVVAASGTGAQEISTLIDKLGSGVSQLIGTGGRDLSPQVGGIMMLDGIRMLQEDPATSVIVVVSKPPAPAVAARVKAALAAGEKPYVVCFLSGADALPIDEAAREAVRLASGTALAPDLAPGTPAGFTPEHGRRYVRGLFSGGTLCDQALMVLEQKLGPVTCNVHPDPSRRGGAAHSVGHTLVDLGDDEFTRGRPHPMIDMTLRRMRLLEEAADPAVAAILLDIVIGHGAHPDPAGALAGAIVEAAGRGVAVVASVTGTEADPQRYSAQVAALSAAGAIVAPTARLAAHIVAVNLEGR